MTEEDVIKRSKVPITRSVLIQDLQRLGLKAGDLVLVHTAMSRIGWVCGGALTIIEALQQVLTPAGTLVMPAHSADVSDPADWSNPAVPDAWLEAIYREMPAFDPCRTPTLGIGTVAEIFRNCPDVRRSEHPIYSFAAWGHMRDTLLFPHALDDGLGMASPLGRIYQQDGRILLIGVDHGNDTSMHLGEMLSGRLKRVDRRSPVRVHGQREWVCYRDWDYHEERFPKIGNLFNRKYANTAYLQQGHLGNAPALLLSQKKIVDFTAHFFKKDLHGLNNFFKNR